MLVHSFCSIMYAEEHGKTINIVVFKQEQVGKAGEIFRERYPKVIDAGYQVTVLPVVASSIRLRRMRLLFSCMRGYDESPLCLSNVERTAYP